jgi:hypothetical protein
MKRQQHERCVSTRRTVARSMLDPSLKDLLAVLTVIVVLTIEIPVPVHRYVPRRTVSAIQQPPPLLHLRSHMLWLLSKQRDSFKIQHDNAVFVSLRGGGITMASATTSDEIDESKPITTKETADSVSSTLQQQPKQVPPVSVMVQTKLGSKILDQTIELPLVNPNKRTIVSIKQSIQRQLVSGSGSGNNKPPLSTIRLLYQGQIITNDDILLAEIIYEDDDDDEEEEDNENNNSNNTPSDVKVINLYLDMIPPVDPKSFLYDIESKLDNVTTAELLQAFAINEAAIDYNNHKDKLYPPKHDTTDNAATTKTTSTTLDYAGKDDPLRTLQIRERAQEIQLDLKETILNTVHARKLLSDPETPNQKALRRTEAYNDIEVRGERVRHIGISGIRGNYNRILQHELNIEDWNKTMKHFVLFLFFGYFGGRTFTSRTVLLLGAPMIILLQTRIVKLYLRQVLFTLLYHPPSIFLSLLPAPQQAILSLSMSDAMQKIYGQYMEMDELTKQLLADDDDGDGDSSDTLSSVLTSKRFTAKKIEDPKAATNDSEDEEEDDDDDDDADDAKDDDDESDEYVEEDE